MNFLRMYKSKKYLLRILLSITLMMVAFLLISSAAQYYNSEKTMLEIQQEANTKVFEQMNYNLDYMNELVKNLAMSTFLDPEITSLMNSKTVEVYELYPKLRMLEKVVNSTSFLHSITIYNANNECFYSTSLTLSCKDDGMNGVMADYLGSHENIPRLEFIPFSLNPSAESSNQVDLFAFFMYDTSGKTKKHSTFSINVKPEWLFNHVKNINGLKGQQDSSTFIMNHNGIILNPDEKQMAFPDEFGDKIIQHLDNLNKSTDYLFVGSGRDKKLISYMSSRINDWVIVSVQPYDVLLNNIKKMKMISMILIACFLILSSTVSVFVSFKLYTPIQTMLKQIGKISNRELDHFTRGKDELSFISSEYTQAIEHVKMLTMDREAKTDIIKKYHLKRLLMDSAMFSRQEVHNLEESGKLKIDLDQKFILALLKINNYEQFIKDSNYADNRLYRFAVANIAEEIISEKFNNEVIDVGKDHLVVLINIAEDTADVIYPVLKHAMDEIQKNTMNFYQLSLMAAISEPIDHVSGITKSYGEILEYSKYRLVYGKTAIIVPSMVRKNRDHAEYHVLAEMEKKLIESIRLSDFEQAEANLAGLFGYVANFSYESINNTIMHTVMTLQNTIKEMNHNNIRQISIDFQMYYQSILNQETLEEVNAVFIDLLRELSIKKKEAVHEGTDHILVETIKEMIEERYVDDNLSLQGIASLLQLSTAHISKIFKQKELVSIVEYITDVRLNQARYRLENTEDSINDIAIKVGFAHQSYFFKLFKKKFGTTPKEYRIKRIMGQA